MSSVSFFSADTSRRIEKKIVLKKFIPLLFREEGKSLTSLSVIFCSDEYLLSLNQQFLQHDYYTDILTFDLSNDNSIIGEIYISLDRVKENAEVHHSSFQKECERIIVHGVMHLCGYKDKTKEEKEIMTRKENESLLKFSTFHVKQ